MATHRPTSYQRGIRAAATALLLFAPCLAAADSIDDRASELLPWVAQHTGYKIDHVKATVLRVDPQAIDLIAYGVAKSGAGSRPNSITAGETVFLPTWFKIGKNDDILVHELTHVLQYANDATFRCRSEREKQAYEVQSDFVDETGIGNKPDKFALFMLQCQPYAVHYGPAKVSN
jgi:hypothetical protein